MFSFPFKGKAGMGMVSLLASPPDIIPTQSSS